ncbi:MAG: riboflavin biosynthesis protein RibF [Acutalibacteraceae bacterium]|nr:riboflavin biosynthesis protein RibF [Acutalibacteraceae bacterium]
MIIYDKIEKLECHTAVALGHFDGLHTGHQLVIGNSVKCKKQGLSPAVLTFKQNPTCVLTGKKVPYLLDNPTKNSFIEKLGVEHLFNLDFESIMDISAEDFVTKILHNQLNAKRVYCGFNYHFGSGGDANSEVLRDLCSNYNIEVVALPPAMFNDEPISSTRIRHYMKQGRITDVTKMLGREYSYKLPVCKGKQLGRRMGTPTFNQPIPENLILPRFGVYATAVIMDNGTRVCGVTNIGIKPTVGSDAPLAETWLPHYNCGELYGKVIEFEILDFIRGEKKFNSIVELKASILSDGESAIKIFNNYYQDK